VSVQLRAGAWAADLLPELGMVGVSLRHRDVELLSLRRGIDSYRQGKTIGIPLLAPWANRLSRRRFTVEGVEVDVDRSPLVRDDERGLPIHGTMTAQPGWEVVRHEPERLVARFAYDTPELLAAFPFPHDLEVDIALEDGLRVVTELAARDVAVPVSFGWHPYFRAPGPRESWTLRLPPRRRVELDERAIPTGAEEELTAEEAPLGERTYDDHFALEGDRLFRLGPLEVEFGEGYPYAQVFAPPGSDFVAVEPMTARVNALVDGGYRLVQPGARFAATFRVRGRSD
jgi:aldose 1-epimerase